MAKNNAKKDKEIAKKIKASKLLTKKTLYPVVFFIVILVMLLFFKNSSYFKLGGIFVVDSNNATQLDGAQLLRLYKGRNIFTIDIVSLSSEIESDYPAIEKAIVKRILPNTLEVDIIPRVPIAKIKSHKYFPIDKTGMVLSPQIKSGKLPVIIGLSGWLRPRVGIRLKNRQLKNAISLVESLSESTLISDYSVTAIDASNYRNLSFHLENGIEVKIGGEDFLERLKKLKTTIANPDLDKENIKYIDLRFKDVVIGPK